MLVELVVVLTLIEMKTFFFYSCGGLHFFKKINLKVFDKMVYANIF